MFGDDSAAVPESVDDPVRVVICDEHDLVRRSLTASLEENQGLEVVAEAAGGAEAVTESLYLAPDVVFISMLLPELAGTQAIGLIADVMPGIALVALAVEETAVERFDALRAGAFGVLDKEQVLASATVATARLLDGAPFIDTELAALLLDRFDALVAGSGFVAMTSRERAVLERLAADREPDSLGADLKMPMREVRNHIANVLYRLRAAAPLEVTPAAHELLAGIGT